MIKSTLSRKKFAAASEYVQKSIVFQGARDTGLSSKNFVLTALYDGCEPILIAGT
jgi:hypothetical protein